MDGVGEATPRSQTKQVRTAHGDVVKIMKKRDTGCKSDAKQTQDSKINLGQRATTNPDIADILTNLQFLTIHINQDKHDGHNKSLLSQLHYKTNLGTGGSSFGNGNYVFGLKTVGPTVKPQQNVHQKYGEGIQNRKLSIRQHQNVDQDTQSTKLRMKFIHTSSEPEHPTSFDQIPAGNQMSHPHSSFPIARQITYSTTSADRLPSPSNPISTFSPENGSLYPAQDSLHFPPFKQAPYSIIPSLNYTFFNDTPADASMTEATDSLGFNIFITPAPPIRTPNLAHVSNLTYRFPSVTKSALSPTSDPQSSQMLQATLNTGAPAGNNQGKQTINPTSTSILTNQPITSSVYSLDMNKVLHQYAHQETTAPRPNHDHPSPPIKLSPTQQSIPHFNSSQLAALNQDLEDVKITEEGSNQSQEALLLALNLSQSLGPSDFLPENTPYVPAIHGGQFHEPMLPSLPQQSALPAPDLLNLPELQSDFVSSFGAYSPQDCLISRVCSIIASLSFVSATTFAFVIPILFPFLGRRRRRSVSPIHTFTKTLKGTDLLDFFQKMMELSRNNNEPQVLEATEAIEEFLQQQHNQLLAMTLSKVPHPVPPSLLRHLTHGHLESLLVTLKDLMDTRHKAEVDAQSLTSQHPNHSAYQYSNSGDDGDFPSTQRPPNPSFLSYASPNPTTTPIPPPSLSNTPQLLHQSHPSHPFPPLSPSHPRLQFPPYTTLQKSEGSDLGQEWGRAREEWTRERKGWSELTHFHKMVCWAVTEPTIPHTDINFFIAQQCLILAHSGLL
ncbi:hypothetical protein Pcinc_030312 [Petrolisthes cinctipes]|nr:hypothetical protein Pcinc_030312 [Petrolisthes cinctipes]